MLIRGYIHRVIAASLALGCSGASFGQALAASSPIASTSLEKLVNQVQVVTDKQKATWFVSTKNIRYKEPKSKQGAEAFATWRADQAWLQASGDQLKHEESISITWIDIAREDMSALNATRFILPNSAEQVGPRPKIEHAMVCQAAYADSDQFGIVYQHAAGCAQGINYSIPITIEVVRYLADRLTSDPMTPMSVTLQSSENGALSTAHRFNFFPAEAQALLIVLARQRGAVKLKRNADEQLR